MRAYRKFTEWSPIRQTVDLLCKVQYAYYNDILIYVNSVYTRKQIHSAWDEDIYLTYRDGAKDARVQCILLTKENEGIRRFIGISQDAEKLFPWISEESKANYRQNVSVPNTKLNKVLAARCAIAAAMMGSPVRVTETLKEVRSVPVPRYYPALILKRDAFSTQEKSEKYRFSQMRGVYETKAGKPIPMYPTATPKGLTFRGYGESKMLEHIKDLFPGHTGELDTCLIIGDTWTSAKATMKKALRRRPPINDAMSDSEKEVISSPRIQEVYRHIHYAPLSAEGVNSLRLFNADPTGSYIIRLLVPKADAYSSALSLFEYDASMGNEFHIQFLTGDIGRLLRITRQASLEKLNLTIYCLPGQEVFLKEQFGKALLPPDITVIDDIEGLMNDLNKEYGLGLEYYAHNR